MKSPKQILVPVDFSPFSAQALDYAMVLAEALDASVHLVNVIGIPATGAPEIGLAFTAPVIDKLTVDNQAALEQEANRYRPSGRLGQVVVRVGDARDMILQAAEEIGADLIVIGTHGRRGLTRALLGSVAETVVRTSPVPVVTVRGRKA